jgi:hypothetical protein
MTKRQNASPDLPVQAHRLDADAARLAESSRILRSIDQEMQPAGLNTNVANGLAGRIGRHFSAKDADQDDAVEVLGRRVGRALSLVLGLALIVWLARFVIGQ